MAVLPDEQDVLVVVEGEDGHGTGVALQVPHDGPAVGQFDAFAHDVPDAAVEHRLALGHRPLHGRVGELRAVDDGDAQLLGEAHAVTSESSSPVTSAGSGSTSMSCPSRWRRSAAATRPENSGCDRVGRDLNSGWAWVPT